MFLRALALPRALATIPEHQSPPVTGDLLRAMRLRRGLSQSEVARKLEMRQGTLAKWEKSEDWPSVERLSALCAVLGARDEEVGAILSGVFLPLYLPQDATVETLEEASQKLIWESQQAPDDPLLDLRFLAQESLLWFRQDCPTTHTLKYWVGQHYISYLSSQRRNSEVVCYADRMLTSPPTTSRRNQGHVQVAIIYKAYALQRRDLPQAQRSPHCQRAITFLRASESRVTDPECQAWYWMTLGALLVETKDIKSAWECVQRSNAVPNSDGHERIHTMEARLSTGSLLVEMDRAQEGIALLEPITANEWHPDLHIIKMRRLLAHTKALIKLRSFPTANEQLRQLYDHIKINRIESMRLRVDDVAQELENAMQK